MCCNTKSLNFFRSGTMKPKISIDPATRGMTIEHTVFLQKLDV